MHGSWPRFIFAIEFNFSRKRSLCIASNLEYAKHAYFALIVSSLLFQLQAIVKPVTIV